VQALAGLVAGPQPIAERLDDVIRGDPQMGRAALEQAQHRHDDTAHRLQLRRCAPVERGRRGEEVAKELEGTVDQMDDHSGYDTRARRGKRARFDVPDAVESGAISRWVNARIEARRTEHESADRRGSGGDVLDGGGAGR